MFSKPQQYSQGDLNADYAVRVNKFFTTYETRPAPEVLGPDPTKPLFKGYQVSSKKKSFGSTKKGVTTVRSLSVRHSSIFLSQIFDPRLVLGECGDFPFGYVEEGETRLRGVKRVKISFSVVFTNGLFSKPQWCR